MNKVFEIGDKVLYLGKECIIRELIHSAIVKTALNSNLKVIHNIIRLDYADDDFATIAIPGQLDEFNTTVFKIVQLKELTEV